jgi:putative hemolysin
MPVDPFSFDLPSSLPGRAAAIVARPLLSRLIGLDALRAAYAGVASGEDESFADRVLTALEVETSAEHTELDRIPRTGPLIVAANHPRGALDGLALAALVRRVRPDVRIVANYVLTRIPELRSTCFFVDPFDGPDAPARSLAGLRSAHLWLRGGGVLILFPAGEVAYDHDSDGVLHERRWSNTLGRLASSTGAAVIPAFLDGGNSRFFYAAGRIHPWLRTLLLPRELLGARNTAIHVRFGHAVEADPSETITMRTQQSVAVLARAERTPAAELAGLAPAARLLRSGRFDVFQADAHEIPSTLREIGRLRALAFQAAGEGTTADVDLDGFDRHYVHLFVWDRDHQAIVGAYRIGRTDRIVREHGVAGLYTRTLFHYDAPLIDALAPALELGRSFVRLEYQRDYQPLLLLWRGIGQFVVRNPEYRCLFGPVSISARYSDASRAVMRAFLEGHHGDAALACRVRPLHPQPGTSLTRVAVPSTAVEVDRLVAGLEPDDKGMPVLLRQYLKLGAKAISISVDPGFSNVTDALMVVDLTALDPAILRRYVGNDGLATYQARHLVPRLSAA